MSTESRERDQLSRGIAALGLGNEARTIDLQLEYVEQLRKWNRVYNLVSASDLSDVVCRHLLDSLSIHSWLLPGSLLDVGTGAGFPGLPLAIARPEMNCTLLDSVGKKVRFLRHIKRTLEIENIHPHESRVSDYSSEGGFNNIVSRAFRSLTEFASEVRHLANRDTRLLAMKGRHPAEELQGLPQWLEVVSVEKIDVPDLHAERHLVIMSVS
ncbi:MAG: 16S rRNA (guanine527-N7)-methyltransferase [Lysobacterales bacterium]|jgi:16S rRNA (guanine527-N7)-methyltransferase